MKSFQEICKMSQAQVKSYMAGYLASKKYKVVGQDGFLYAKGTVPVLLLAHMDTVHKELCTVINEKDGILSSPQGIGGDDRCGIFIIMNIVKELNCSVLLCEDEEIGAVGARKFAKTEYVKNLDVNYIVEFDRKGDMDAVFYQCDNKKFTSFITEMTGFKEAVGSFSDISVVAPAAGIAAVNLSSGYYKAHTKDEFVDYGVMMDTIETAKNLIKAESEKYEYVKKEYSYSDYHYGGYDDYSYGGYGGYGGYGRSRNVPSASTSSSKYQQTTMMDRCLMEDMDIHLELLWVDESCNEHCAESSGKTKAEAWANFFMDNPEVSFSMLCDWSFF